MAPVKNEAAASASLVAEPGRVAVRGAMTFATVGALYDESLGALHNANGSLTIDLGDVDRTDSAGVALILEWYRLAKSAGHTFALVHIPDQVVRLIKVSGLSHLLH